MPARASETRLHLVGNHHTARLSDRSDGGSQKIFRQIGETFIGKERIDDKAGKAERAFLQRSDGLFHLRRPRLREGFAPLTAKRAIAVGCRHMAHMTAIAAHRRHSRRKLRNRRRIAVIGEVGCDDAGLARYRLRHVQGHVIRLAAGAGENCRIEAFVESRCQPFDIIQNSFMQIARMGVEGRSLTADRLHHTRMAMAHMRHIVIAIEIFAPVRIPEPDTLTLHQMHRVLIK